MEIIGKNNMFMDWIYRAYKSDFKLLHRIKYYLFKRKLLKVSPDYNMLVQIYDFVKLLELVCFYENVKKGEILHTVKSKKPNGKSFSFSIISVEHLSPDTIIFTMWTENDKNYITIDILKEDSKTSKAHIEFEDGKGEVKNIHEEYLLINIIDTLMYRVIYLMDHFSFL